ncbi:hypothetical protein Tco_1453868 [Tanacetum coccineum]
MERDEVMAEGGGGRRRDDGVNGDGDDGVAAAEVANGEAADLAGMVRIWPEIVVTRVEVMDDDDDDVVDL